MLQELTLRDSETLLKAYKQAARHEPLQKEWWASTNAVDGDILSKMPGRFSHCSFGSLRVADVELVLHDIRKGRQR